MLYLEGINVPTNFICSSHEDAIAIIKASQMSYPVVVKGMGVAHKTEEDLVSLNIDSTELLIKTIDKFAKKSKTIMAEQMISDIEFEISVGIIRDVTGVFLVAIGAGVFFRTILRKCFITFTYHKKNIEACLKSLPLYSRVDGYRRSRPVGKDLSVNSIQKIVKYAEKNAP